MIVLEPCAVTELHLVRHRPGEASIDGRAHLLELFAAAAGTAATKLGLSSRSAATAYAYDHDLV